MKKVCVTGSAGFIGSKVLEMLLEGFYQADMQTTCADINKAQGLLNWRSKVSLEEGIKRTVDWTTNNWQWIQKIKI